MSNIHERGIEPCINIIDKSPMIKDIFIANDPVTGRRIIDSSVKLSIFDDNPSRKRSPRS